MKKDLLLLAFALVLGMVGCQSRSASAFAPSGDPSYAVDFSRPIEDWWCEVRSEPPGDYYCTGGEFHVVNRAVNPSGQAMAAMGGPHYKNFMLQVQSRSVGESGSYGVFFRASSQDIYVFRVRPAGEFQFMIWRLLGAVDTVLLPWAASPAIHKSGDVNLLQVIASGSRITLFANGQELASLDDDTVSEGFLGVMAAGDAHAAFSSLKVWKLP